ncbi:MAG TPA: polymorphic toxin-type HINT domain-containing protein, partial [Oligoflexus sp.]|uniref:polymorphic toxin-type HINT domain-containing protein n=1 Tax=Oligoflexus sp. TaxID=1971216 RepID=UPI002D73BA07
SGAQTRSFIEKFVYTLDGALQESVDPQGVRSFYRLSPTMRFTHLELELPWQRGTRETIVDNVKYSPKGQVEQIAYRKGSYTNLAYDSKTLLLTQIESSYQKADGQREFLQYASLAFDGNGSITEITDTIPAQTSYGAIDRSAKFTYNDRDELVEFKRYGETQSFDYDGAGNFTRNTELGSQLAPVTGNTLLPRSSVDHRYTFDAQGQLKSRKFMGTVASQDPLQDLQKRRQILDTRFNSLGQLVYLKTDTQEIYYGYDSDGQRSYKRIAATGTHVAADSLFPTKTFTVEPTGGQSFVLIGDRRIARIEHAQDTFSKGQWFYYLLDHLGSTDFTMNSDGTPVEQMIYRAYGTEPDINLLTQGIVWKNHQNTHQSMMPKERTHHRYTGQYLDDDSGLYYYGSRYYDPQLGRFISPDDAFLENPESCIERPLECNAYGYAANNPVKYSDPTGKWAHIVIGAVVGGVIGGAADAIFNPNSNWKTVAAAAAGGTVTGALAAATGGASLAAQSTVSAVAIGAGVGAASAGAGNVVQQGINLASNQQKSFSGTQLGTSMAIGGLAGGAGAAVSRGLSSAASRALRATPCGCFAPGTLVMTPDGLKPIESLQAGDLVMAQDVATGKLAAKAIAQTFHYELRPYYELTFADDQGQIETITVTDDHPIFIKDAGWVRSKDLKAGQELVQSNGKNARIISFAFTGRFGKTFNFEVQDFHTYFVANHGILVHNNTPCNTAVGYAAGVAKSAFTPDRLQHASRHLIDDGILPNWSKATAQKFTEMGTKILEAPIKTFDHVLRGNNPVKAFYGVVDGKDIVVMVYKSGVDQGKVATAVQATSQQVQNWGLH